MSAFGTDAAVGAVALDQVHDVVRDHRREPAHLVARVGEVVGDVRRRADDALELRRVASRLLSSAPGGVHDPRDDLGVGELDDHAVADAPRDRERLRAVARDPDGDLRQLLAHPLELEILVVPVDLAAVHELAHHRERLPRTPRPSSAGGRCSARPSRRGRRPSPCGRRRGRGASRTSSRGRSGRASPGS